MAVQLLDGAMPSPLSTLIDDYLLSVRAKGLSPRSEHQYAYALRNVFLPWCRAQGIQRVEDLDRRTLDRFTATLLDRRSASGKPLSKFSVHTYIRPIRIMLSWAAAVGEDVKAKPALPRRPTLIRDVLSREELDLLERAAVNERDRVIIRIFADCGLRLEELSRLTSGDIIRSGRQAHLRVLGKRSRMRDVPVPPTLLRRIERLIAGRPDDRETDHIFLTVRRSPSGLYQPLSPDGAYQVVKDAVERSGISKRVYPHLLRHSWMTEMLRNGMNPIQLSIIAGASVDVISQHYTHLTKDDAYEAMLRVLTARER
jgi:site-specific recombinase XerD